MVIWTARIGVAVVFVAVFVTVFGSGVADQASGGDSSGSEHRINALGWVAVGIIGGGTTRSEKSDEQQGNGFNGILFHNLNNVFMD